MEKYSIWLIPSGAEYDRLQLLVSDLAAQYKTPRFLPHVTVLGDTELPLEEMKKKTQALAKHIKPISTRLTTIEWAIPEEYFRSFYVLVEPTDALRQLDAATGEVFGKKHRPPFHMSLMYTDRLSIPEREAIREKIYRTKDGKAFNEPILLNRLQVCGSNATPENWNCPFELKLH